MLGLIPAILRRTAKQNRKVVRFGETGLDGGNRRELRWPQVRTIVVLSKGGLVPGVAIGYTTR